MQNISNGNLPTNQNFSTTSRYFNNFFQPTLNVNSNIDGSIISYFETLTGNKESAKVLASSVLYTALTQGLDPMQILTELNNITAKNFVETHQNITYAEQVQSNTDQYAKPGPTITPKFNTEINAYLTMFLNLNRVNTSLLGITNQPQTSKYVSRAILP